MDQTCKLLNLIIILFLLLAEDQWVFLSLTVFIVLVLTQECYYMFVICKSEAAENKLSTWKCTVFRHFCSCVENSTTQFNVNFGGGGRKTLPKNRCGNSLCTPDWWIFTQAILKRGFPTGCGTQIVMSGADSIQQQVTHTLVKCHFLPWIYKHHRYKVVLVLNMNVCKVFGIKRW